MPYKIGVIGTGYVGLVSGTGFAESGNTVYCVDLDEEKVEKLKRGIPPIYEPGLERLIDRNSREERLKFTTKLEDAVKNCEIIFLCLPTPPDEDGSADLKHVLNAATDIGNFIRENNIRDYRLIVNKSTVPVGTAEKVKIALQSAAPGFPIEVVSNPEFLREGFAVEDFIHPERVVIGVESKRAEEVMRDLYEPFVRTGNPILVMDIKSAEVSKYASNAFLAMKISFMNDLSEYCELVGADIENVRISIGSDSRIGKRFLFAGIGYGGSCFPKDVRALLHSTQTAGTPLTIMRAVEDVNAKQTARFIKRIFSRFDDDVKGRHFAIWGLSFKPNTDDVREAPSFKVIDSLLEAGATLSVYDPEAINNTRKKYGDLLNYADGRYDCLENADSLIIVTEWNEFKIPDFDIMRSKMKQPIIFDGRNLYDLRDIEKSGFEYYSVGRRKIIPND